MPNLNVVGVGVNEFSWFITDLGFIWDTNQYAYAFVVIPGVASSAPVYAPSPVGSGNNTGLGFLTGLTGGTTYTAYGYVVTAPPGNATFEIGSVIFTTSTPPDTTPPTVTSFAVINKGQDFVQLMAFASDGGSGVSGFYFTCSNGASNVVYGSSSAIYTFTGLFPSTTYSFGVQAFDVAGNWSGTTTTSTTTLNARPSDAHWNTPKTSGQNVNVTATEWNNLANKINEFRFYRGLGSFSFTTVTIGTDILAWIFNQAVSAIVAMSPTISPPSSQSTGNDMYADYFNGLIRSVNSIT